jgi:myo-inositol catabolism protein IolS
MDTRKLGHSGQNWSVLTMGCWQAGGAQWENVQDEASIDAMRAAFDAGITSYDTAEAYNEGYSERILAKALGTRRDSIFIATKVGAGNLSHDKVIEACERSLRNLSTDRIDLYQIHWPAGTWGSPIIPIEETMRALVTLKKQGKIKAIGVSNFNGRQIEEALSFGVIDSLQPPYSLFWDAFERDGTFEMCVKHGISVIPYSPLAQGLLTGKFNRDNRPKDNRAGNVLFQDPVFDNAVTAIEQLSPIADKYGVNTGQLSLAWLLQQPAVASVIVGARLPDQVKDNAQAASIQLAPDDIDHITRIGRTVTSLLPDTKTNMWA